MTRREQILKCAELKHNVPIHRQTEYEDGKEMRQYELMPLIVALADRIQELEGVLQYSNALIGDQISMMVPLNYYKGFMTKGLLQLTLEKVIAEQSKALSNTSALDALLKGDE